MEGKRALSQEEGEALLRAFGLSLGEEEGLRLRLLAEPHPLFGPVLVLVLPTPLGDQVLEQRLSPLTAKDAEELLRPLAGRVEGLPAYKELVLRVSRMLEELPQVERLLLELSGPRVAAFTISLRAD